MQKYVREVFLDYRKSSPILDAEIEEINLYKKLNKLELSILCNKSIDISQFEDFENYLINRFKVSKVSIDINYNDVQIEQNIGDNWKNIIDYITKKAPFSKAVLLGSKPLIASNSIQVELAIKGADFLCSKKFDKGLEHLLKNIYGKNYVITFKENIDQDYLEKFLEHQAKEEQEIVNHSQEKEEKSDLVEVVPIEELPDFLPPEEEIEDVESKIIMGRSIELKGTRIRISDITEDTPFVAINGEMISDSLDSRDITTKTGKKKKLFMFNVYDGSSSITVKGFVDPETYDKIASKIGKSKGVIVDGKASYDDYSHEITIMANTILQGEGITKQAKREDNAEKKRVELHMHTQMSQLDAVTSVTDLLKRCMDWGWKAAAITDHGVVQSFPDANSLVWENENFKAIYGVEAYFTPDKDPGVFNSHGQSLDSTYCILDLETTGISYLTEKITEVGIIKYSNGKRVAEFETFVNPEKHIPEKVQEVTHITDDMVKDAPTIDKVIPKMIEFIGDSIVVTHNTDFDVSYLKYNYEKYGYKFENTYIDTLRISKTMFTDLTKFRLGIIADYLGIEVENAHRALDDVITLTQVFERMIEKCKNRDGITIDDFVNKFESDFRKLPTYHMIILVKDYVGLRNLYKLVSISHVDNFYRHPRILKSVLDQNREGLIIGSACEQGELYRAILDNRSDEEIRQIASYYDYLEIQPIGNDEHLTRNVVKEGRVISEKRVENDEALRDIVRKIVAIGEELEKPVVATCDVHFMDPEDEIYRRILQAGQKYEDADMQAPLYLRTTDEMLKEFEYLGKEKAYEVVVENTNKIADMIEKISPISPEKCAPHIPGCEDMIRDISYKKAHELYGDPLPKIVEDRLEKELESIIKNGFSVMYIIAQKLVSKSNEDGYLVGSRGSVGSSFAAYTTGITEVNSLPPHYRCPKCKYSDFDIDLDKYQNGFDLPDKACPKCGEKLGKDGMNIPFETFLGFDGDKEPDIDLNFSGEYQAKAHKYTEVIFGKGTTFKAGTVSGVQDKTAFGYVKGYYEDRNIPITNAEITRLAKGCTGVKRTTGQHPGGIIVVPKGREIYEFTPVQHPADDADSDIITTHFDYHKIDQNLLKLDILGHDDPTMIRMLQDITGVKPEDIPLDDKDTLELFSSTKSLGVTPEQINSEVGSFGVPEFGTKFVRGMLVDTKPKTFDELVRISGLSHGTDVWLNNAADLIAQNIVTLREAICCRDDIMIYLIQKGLPANTAFKIMESVRKGKVAKGKEKKWDEYKQIMKEHDVPDWYIGSCEKIKYMFPKAHAAAYVTMAFRIAWFKVHIPKAYYAAYFSIRAKQLDSDVMYSGKENVRRKMKEIDDMGYAASNKDQEMYPVLELVLEMYERGIKFLPPDLYKSHHTNFIVEDEGLRVPLSGINGLGPIDAENIYNAAKEDSFMSIDELRTRAKIGSSAIEVMRGTGLLDGLSESNQVSLFDM
jgi:DNA polymerase-3 subunit alpha (Gram-positive type)